MLSKAITRLNLLFLLIIGFIFILGALGFADDYEEQYLKLDSYTPVYGINQFAPNAQKINKNLSGITFDSNYDNGSILDITSTGANTFTCTLATDSGESGYATYWFRFKMTGVAGRTITLNINHSQNPRPVISFDSVTWRRLTSTEAPNSNSIALTFGATTNFAEVAFFYPLGYSETLSKVSSLVVMSTYGTISIIGQSFQGRNMLMVTVQDTTVPNTGKHRIWVHSRAHAGEATGTYCMLGFLEQALENSSTGRQLRNNCIFNIVPIENCDGVYLGKTRWDSQGIDPERQWPNPSRIPEVANMKAQIDTFMAGAKPIQVALNLHSTVSNFADSFFWKHLSPSVTTTFENIEQNYINSVDSATPLFNNLDPQYSQLDPSLFIESYFWNNWHESVMAMTHEGHYYFRTGTSQYVTDQDYKDVGKALAVGLIQYFNLQYVPVELSRFSAE
jgi:hypothetical protein